MSIQAALREFRAHHPKMAAAKCAQRFLMETPDADLSGLIRDEIERIDRNDNRALEIQEIARLRSELPGASEGASGSWSAQLRTRLYQTGAGDDQFFGLFTSAQHRLKARMLRSQAAGLIRTAELHERAADDIEAAGVTCLDELPTALAA